MQLIQMYALLLTVVLALTVPVANAAEALPPSLDPGSILERSFEEQQRLRKPEKGIEPGKVGEQAPAPVPKPDERRVKVRSITFSPSRFLTEPELQALATPYTGREVTVGELSELVTKVNTLYRARRALAAQAVLPAQDVTEGTIRIELIEGVLGEIRIAGNQSTRQSYLLGYLSTTPGELIDIPRLEKSLAVFNRTNDARMNLDLAAGAKHGTTDFVVTVAEPSRHALRLLTDNGGSNSTGEYRLIGLYSLRSLLGYRDELTLGLSGSDGTKGYSLSYDFPLGTWGTRLLASYNEDRMEIVEGPLAQLGIDGRGRGTHLKLRHPVLTRTALQGDAFIGGKDVTSNTQIQDAELSSVENSAYFGGFDLDAFSGRMAWAANVTFQTGEARNPGGSQHYNLLRAYLRSTIQLAEPTSATIALAWQEPRGGEMPLSEHFVIGGDTTVRGYKQGVTTGDRGRLAQAELHHRLGRFGRLAGEPIHVVGLAFANYGYVSRIENAIGRDELASLGAGLILGAGDRYNLRLAYGRGLISHPDDPQPWRIHFAFAANFL